MTTTNYAIVSVLNNPEDRGQERHYAIVRDYEYLEDARFDFKYDSVEVHKEAEEIMHRHDHMYEKDEHKFSAPYHLEVVKLRWSGNYDQVAKSYTKWFN